jgi:hypothetical protein
MATQFNWRDWISKSENQQLAANLALGAAGAMGAKGDRDYARDIQQQNRGDSIQDKQRQGYLGRANSQNELLQSGLDDDYRGAAEAASISDPFKYKRELQRDANRAMQLKKAASMLGMPTSGLFNDMNNDDAIIRRNASAVMNNEMNAQDVNPGRASRNVGSLMGMNPMSSAVSPQNSQLQQYIASRQGELGNTRGQMMGNVNSAYDKYDDSIKQQLLSGKDGDIDPVTGKKKTSTWRKILGGAVKYGVPIALAATGVGAPAAAAMLAGSSLAGDKIAGKSWTDAALGAGMAAIPGGQMGSGMASGIANKVGRTAVEQGLRAAGENIPYVGAGLTIASAAGLPKAIGNSGGGALTQAVGKGRPLTQQPGFQTYRPQLSPNIGGAYNPNVFKNVRF